MPVTLGNIVVGSANFFEGDATSLRDYGATQGGVTLAMGGNDFARIEIDQLRGVAALEQIMRSFLVRTTLTEPTLQNLCAGFNMNEDSYDSSNDIFTIEDTVRNSITSDSDDRRVVFVGPAPGSNKHRSAQFDNCMFVGTPETNYTRGEATVLAVEIEVIPEARTRSSSCVVEGPVDASGVQVKSYDGAEDIYIRADKLIGGEISDTSNNQSRAIVDSTAIATATGAGSFIVYPSFTTTPLADDVIVISAQRATKWGEIRDIG